MAVINILHLSDLHYDKSKRRDLDIVLRSLFDDLRLLSTEHGVDLDFVFFSGDLVHAGHSYDTFLTAHDSFVLPLLERLRLPLNRFLIVPGNHDIDRDVVKSLKGFVEFGLRSQLASSTAVNDFIDEIISGDSSDAAQLALSRLSNFRQYADSRLESKPRFTSPFATVEDFFVKGVSVSVSCLNTAWRATGEPGHADYGKLLLGERAVDLAAQHAIDSQLRLSIFHHPFNWLQERDAFAVQARLHATFDVLFFGHVHFASPVITTTAYGSSVLSQSGCLYQSRDYFNGYGILSIDAEAREVAFTLRTYHDRSRRFGPAEDVFAGGRISYQLSPRMSGEAEAAIDKVLRNVQPIVRMRANRHLAMIAGLSDSQYDIKETFVCPPILRISESRNVMPRQEAPDRGQGAVEVANDSRNYLIRGARESGRTSLAHYFAVLVSEGVSDTRRVPAVIDLAHMRRGRNTIRRAVRQYFIDAEMGPIDKQIPSENWLLILDNADPDTRDGRALLEEVSKEFPRARVICLAEELHPGIQSSGSAHARDTDYELRFIGSLPRRSIRELATRWSVRMGRDQDATFQAVMLQLQRGRLPRTGYIVSLTPLGNSEEPRTGAH